MAQNQNNFDATMKKFDATIDRLQNLADTGKRIANLSESNMLEATGGNSYVYFEFTLPGGPIEVESPGIHKGVMLSDAFLKFVGKYPLHNVYDQPSDRLVGYQISITEQFSQESLAGHVREFTFSSDQIERNSVLTSSLIHQTVPIRRIFFFLNLRTNGYGPAMCIRLGKRSRFEYGANRDFQKIELTLIGIKIR